jgi:hypothetical protein
MKKTVCLAALLAFLAVFGSFPSAAEPIHEKATSDPLQNLFDAGWVQVSSGVLTRDLGHGQVEVLGLGAEGLQYRLQEMRRQLRHLKATYDAHPTPDLKDAVRAYRSEIRRLMERLETAKAADELEAATKAVGIDCTINYGAHVNAFPLSGSAQGVGANADSYFNSNCGQNGEVWAHAYGEGRKADNSFWTATKTDPLAGGSSPYIGMNVRANASISLNVVSSCYSYSYASMTSYDINVVYEQRVENRSCPVPVSPLSNSVTSNYGSYIELYGTQCATVTWTANPSGGLSPYTYSWTSGTSTTVLGTAKTYSRTFCGSNTNTTSSFTANANVKDSSSPQQSKTASHTLTIYHYYQSSGGGGSCATCPAIE